VQTILVMPMNRELKEFFVMVIFGIVALVWAFIGLTMFAYRGPYFYPTIYNLAIILMIAGVASIALAFIVYFLRRMRLHKERLN